MSGSGALRIFRYNWTTYVGTWLGGAAMLSAALGLGGSLGGLLAFGAMLAVCWSAVSLLVSHHVYDRSELSRGTWVTALLSRRQETWCSIDAGLDAEVALDDVIPGACIARLDIYDSEHVRAPSVRRARAITPRAHEATRARANALPLSDESCDLITVVFSAHELREVAIREAFFEEVRRVLRPGGRMLLVEHLRDWSNFAAFGPGFLHFLPRVEWLRLAQHAGLHVAQEIRVTPWVMALALEKIA